MSARAESLILVALSALALSACTTPASESLKHRSPLAALSGEERPAHSRRPFAARYGSRPGAKVVDRSADPKVQTVNLSTHSWRWPLDRVRVTSTFGERSGDFHDGIDLQAPLGTPVYAAEGGRVVFAGSRIRGYGRMVVLKHPRSGLMSVYAHLQRPLVKKGQWVSKGQKIALSGESGRASGPHLHFEIRNGVTAIDPVQMMTTQLAKQGRG